MVVPLVPQNREETIFLDIRGNAVGQNVLISRYSDTLRVLVHCVKIGQTTCTLKMLFAVRRRMQILRTFCEVTVSELELETSLKLFGG